MATETLTLDVARDLIRRALLGSGVSDVAATSTAAALVAAEAEGQSGHGFSRLADYAAQARSGKVNGTAIPALTKDAPTLIHIDAGYGFAFPALDLAAQAGAEAAREFGSAVMAISKSHHCGALSVQVDRLARQGLVAMMVANSPAAIAPWGARTPLYGTNPIAFAAPRADGPPLVIDLSMSVVARGKIMHAKKSGQPIPEGWALDGNGAPTTDPEAALAGTMVPMGGPKGTALALMVEILSAAVTGANPSAQAHSFFTADGPPPGTGQFLSVFRAPGDPGAFAARLEAILASVEGAEGARLPGARRIVSIAKAEAEGLAVPTVYLDGARALASGTG